MGLHLVDLLILLGAEAVLPRNPAEASLEAFVYQAEEADRGRSVRGEDLPRVVLLELVDELVDALLGQLGGNVFQPGGLLWAGIVEFHPFRRFQGPGGSVGPVEGDPEASRWLAVEDRVCVETPQEVEVGPFELAEPGVQRPKRGESEGEVLSVLEGLRHAGG